MTGRKKTEEHHFLISKDIGRYTVLEALPGQTLGKEAVSPQTMIAGCVKYRKAFPSGSVFGTTTLKKVRRGGGRCYEVSDLYFLGETDPFADLLSEVTRQRLIEEFRKYNDDDTQQS